MVAASLVAASVVYPGSSARADDPIVFPSVELYADPSFNTSKGVTVLSEEPTLWLSVYDLDWENPLPAFDFEMRIDDDSTPPVEVVTETIAGTRVYSTQYAEWPLPTATLSEGETYYLYVRLHAGAEQGPWSSPIRIHSGGEVDPPTLVSPIDNTLVQKTGLTLRADVGTEEGADVAFRVEANWTTSAYPVEVASGTTQTDADGVAQFTPDLSSYGYEEGQLRWQAFVQGDGHSGWSDFEEVQYSSLPSPVYSPTAIQDGHSVSVSWGRGDYLSLAPILGYTATLTPGDITVSLPANQRSATFNDLPFGEYDVTVSAINTLGAGPQTTVAADIGNYRPSEPRNVQSEVELTEATVSWDAPLDLGGGILDGYEVYLYGSACDDSRALITTEDEFIEFDDLIEGCQYYVSVHAVTAAGASLPGFAAFVAYGLPAAPTEPEVRRGDGYLDVYWTAAYDNGSPVSSYVVSVSPGTDEFTVPAQTSWARQVTRISDLTNGTNYTFSIVAVNAAGEGDALATSSTSPNEGVSDQDLDGLTDRAEEKTGTDPLLTDTDGDSIGDFQEVTNLSGLTDPLLADTDDNAVEDSAEDFDGDSLSNLSEITGGTSPLKSDTDSDGINDDVEMLAGTDPVLQDTDADGLSDSFEGEIGSDPLIADSDSDAEGDDAELISRTIATNIDEAPDGISVAEVDLEGPAGTIQDVTVEMGEILTFPGVITMTAQINGGSVPPGPGTMRTSGLDPPTPINLRLDYPDSASTLLSNLAPIAWDEELGTWNFVDNDLSVSTAEQTITIEDPLLGVRYAVVNLDEWRANANQCYLAEQGAPRLDVEILFDTTWSVAEEDTTGTRFDAMRTIVESLRPGDRVTIRKFGVAGIYSSRGGDANLYAPDSRMVTSDTAPDWTTMTVAEALFAVDELEANAATITTNDEADLFDNVNNNLRLIERSIGGIEDTDDLVAASAFEPDPAECRVRTIVLVTDGGMKPPTTMPSSYVDEFPDGYVFFRNRTDVAVHVLDVGVGTSASSSWLEDLADDTDGTYSYVPTATDIDDWIDEVAPYGWVAPESATLDTDDDGIPDKVEIRGIVPVSGRVDAGIPTRFTSDPEDADTDGDGVEDGVEIGVKATAAQLGLPTNAGSLGYVALANPRSVDTDSDGLGDLDEIDLGYNAFRADMDADLLSDGEELTWGTLPNSRDTDGDGHVDSFEVEAAAQGFDPLVRDEIVSETVWLEDWSQGLICGEDCPGDSPGWLIGNIMSGILVLGDLRDFGVFIRDGNYVSAVFTAVGFLPALGDGVRSLKVLESFSARTSVAAYKRLVEELGSEVAEQNPAAFARFLDEIDPTLVGRMGDEGVTDTSMLAFLVSKMPVERLNSLLDAPTRQAATKLFTATTPIVSESSFRLTGKAGERYVYDVRLGTSVNYEQKLTLTPGGKRFYDLIQTVGSKTVYVEVKTGYTTFSAVSAQIAKDALMVGPSDDVLWIFVASRKTGIGPDPRVLEALTNANIKFEIHWP